MVGIIRRKFADVNTKLLIKEAAGEDSNKTDAI
jgi:hypothetical protein